MAGRYGEQLAGRLITLRLIAGFALVALFLATIGIYGVIAQLIAGRTGEIGLRMALGADARQVLRWAVGRGVPMIVGGLVAGVALAAATSRLLESLLYETSTVDTATYAAVSAALGVVALIACYLPARRATRVDPTMALRNE